MASERNASLESLLQALPQFEDLTIDSRRAKPGSVFVALRGEHTDGHRFIAQAVELGATAIVSEEACDVPEGVTAVIVPDTARALSQLADAFFASPSQDMAVCGITGTNGKTTTSQMVAAIFNAAGIACGTIGTIGARFGEREWPLANTTPLAPELQELLAQMRDLGAKAVAMEVSSHALALQRVEDIRFAVGALTNVTRDHLDFHKTFDAYAAAKRRLFDMAPRCVFNAGGELGARWARELRIRKPVLTYGLQAAADLHPSSVELHPDGSDFELDGQRYVLRIPGRFNVENALCAIAIARHLHIAGEACARGLASLERVAGRMDHVRGAGVDVIVDYAHTPDALENALRTLRETASHRLVVVFGCGGDRDRGKRPQMGEIAARYADYTYVTSDNPRTEDPNAIIEEILPGIGSAPHTAQSDRRAAIEEAIRSASAGDVVLIAGKGHEAYQIVGTEVLPFDDLTIAREALHMRETAAR
jgi:UDP-N-acetylmuramoyl-L-alanyl-D-glutamate--2,6-diaminopimelate ligase